MEDGRIEGRKENMSLARRKSCCLFLSVLGYPWLPLAHDLFVNNQ